MSDEPEDLANWLGGVDEFDAFWVEDLLEWLSDHEMLSEKGVKLRQEFWEKYCKNSKE